MKKFFLLNALAFSLSPWMAHAIDITINNNTNLHGTGYINSSPCSSFAGENGIIKPHSSLTIPQAIMGLFCIMGMPCEAHVFMTKDCSGKEIATAKIDLKKGILDYTNLDPEHFDIQASGGNVNVTQK